MRWKNLSPSLTLVLGALLLPTQAGAAVNGLLRVHPTNKRYLTNNSGEAIVLGGSHTWAVFQQYEPCLDESCREGFDYSRWLNDLKGWKHNFFRGWIWEDIYYGPQPYMQVGGSNATRLYDLDRYSAEWTQQMVDRVTQANAKGLYVSVMLFQGWSVDDFNNHRVPDPWPQHPYHEDHNIDSVDGDPNNDGRGFEVHRLGSPGNDKQFAFVRHVVTKLNHLDNVIWEIANEANSGSHSWQERIISVIRRAESRNGRKKHLIWFSCSGTTPKQSTNADLIAPCKENQASVVQQNPLEVRPTNKVMIADSDHLEASKANHKWAWKAFLRGYHPIFMDQKYPLTWWSKPRNTTSSEWQRIREALGGIQHVAGLANLAGMVPQRRGVATPVDLVGYNDPNFALYSTNRVDRTAPGPNGREYLALEPRGGKTLRVCGLRVGRTYRVHWRTLKNRNPSGPLSYPVAGSNCQDFRNPRSREARLLHLTLQ